ncbi:hypothetical protein [Corynebacterium sp.]|mgnify:CR=1 FL=1|uniref:hypothetical protein n=1 Tax=Corynebacterium sp. TaxID=1720 RepID=UPI0025BB1799|nr:hypothetical protein [Corynebacterium sp.]
METPPTEPLNPVQVEQRIMELSNMIAAGVQQVTNKLRAYRQADAAYDRAKAHAQLAADGKTVADREAEVELATIDERDAKDFAEVEYSHVNRRVKAFEKELDAIRSIGANVRQMYSVAGRGEGA